MTGEPGEQAAAPALQAALPRTESPAPSAPAAHAVAHAHAAERCENCGQPLTGPYCSACGQHHGHSVHSVWHFTREATEDLTHADSRLWRTLFALLLRPGALTREYLDGHRVRYLPPLRLYLILSLVFFLLAALSPPRGAVVMIGTDSQPDTGLPVHVHTRPLGSKPLDATQTCQEVVKGMRDLWSPFGPLEQRLTAACVKAAADGGAAYRAAFLDNLPRALFVFLPLLALFPLLLYWRPRHYYVEHLLFLLHNHAFLFLLFSLDLGLRAVTPTAVSSLFELAAWAYVLYYLLRAMRRMYGQSWGLTIAKFLAMACVYGFAGIAVLVGTALYSVLTL